MADVTCGDLRFGQKGLAQICDFIQIPDYPSHEAS